ncbi:MAG: glycosyltransferase family 2 protein [Planctomycetota bacterium]|nr:glycosyltransferase family 2 protein [Planctomycetota bacterium]MDA0932576.1 glycosyltransferase family 2 protein [Planctomycetota bacterium]MDA1220872.1 glycosyltransferase family 2 protein [Planctomycetota bacterium]
MISAVVINWNGREYLEGCLGSLLAQEPRPDEVILVDNHSGDGSREFAAERFPSVRVVDAGANVGPARARNLGVLSAAGDRVLLVDNDVVLPPGTLSALVATLDADPRCAAVQARSVCADQTDVLHYDTADLHVLGTLVLHGFFAPRAVVPPPVDPVGAVIALCLLVRRDAFEDVGGFCARMFILYEDNDLSYRLRMRGHTLRTAPDTAVLHAGGTAGLSFRSPDARYAGRRVTLHTRNRWLLLLRCMRWRTLVLTAPIQLLYAVVYTAFAASRGAFLAAMRGHLEAALAVPWALRARRSIQQRRVVADRDLLVALPMTANPGLADRGPKAWIRRGLDLVCRAWWSLVRPLCG